MQFNAENYGSNAFLVQKLESDDVLDSTCLGMLSSNEIDGVAKVIFSQVDGDRYLKYNVTSRIPMKQFFARRVNRTQLLNTFIGICNALIAADDYMLPQSSFLIESEYIYVDVIKGKVTLLCVPLEKEWPETDLKLFFRRELVEATTDPNENGDYVARILSYLNSMPQISLSAFRSFLTSLQLDNKPGNQDIPPAPAGVRPADTPPKVEPTPTGGGAYGSGHRPGDTGNRVERPAVNPWKPAEGDGMNIPPVPGRKDVDPPLSDEPGQPMSILYLLRNYSKENKEAYFAQKKQKGSDKDKKAAPKSKIKVDQKHAPEKSSPKQGRGEKNKPNIDAGFAIPGMDSNQSFEQAPMPENPMPETTGKKTNYKFKNDSPNDNGFSGEAKPAGMPSGGSMPQMNGQHVTDGRQPYTPEPQQANGYWNDDDYDDPTLVTDQQPISSGAGMPYLIRISTQERIPITKSQFRIGRGSQYPDYNIRDNRSVGHSHAIIVKRGSDYYVMDTNSKNHTFLNDDPTPIPPNTEIKLEHGMKVIFANEAFEFMKY